MTKAAELAKIISGGAVFNEDSADVNFRVESNGQANMLFVDGGNDTVSFQPNSGTLTIKAGSGDATNNVRLEAGGTTSTYLEYRGYLGHQFYVDTTEHMRMNSSGYVGIGTNNPTEPFQVYNGNFDGAVARFLNIRDTSNANGIKVTIGSSGGASGTNSTHFHGNTNAVGNWYLYANGTTSYSSDERLKKNIETTRDGYLEDLAKLRVVKYNWNCDKDGDNKELGLIAQEVEKVFPNLVKDDTNPISEDDPTMYKQLKQSVLPMMLLKALQEANTKITALEARITALEAEGNTIQEAE